MPKVIRSKRVKLLLNAILGLAIVIVAGWLLQSWRPLESSPLGRLSEAAHMPLIEFVVWALGLTLVGTVLLDHWNFCIEMADDHLLISERFGITKVYYDNIEAAYTVPLGAGLVLKDRERWLETFHGRQSGLEKLRKTSAFLKGVYGCDLCIKHIRLDTGAKEFLSLLNERTTRTKQNEGGAIAEVLEKR